MGDKKAYFIVLLVQMIYTVMFLVSKAAFNGGMNNFVFVFYRQAAATLFLVPIALFTEWKTAPALSFRTFCKIFVHSLLGFVSYIHHVSFLFYHSGGLFLTITLSMDVYGAALIHTSASLAAATSNCLPAITFFLAVLFRMEGMKLRSRPGMAKLVGVVASIGGAVTLALYKGSRIKLLCLHELRLGTNQQLTTPTDSWIKGCFLMLISNILWALWLIFQGQVIKSIPSKLLLTTLQSFLSTIQSFVIAIALERNPYEWRLGWDMKLLAISYCGIVVTGVTFYLQSWVIEKKGPVFIAMSTPLNLIFTTLCSAILLCEVITSASILGGVMLVAGLYCVLWGKSRENFSDTTSMLIVNKELRELNQTTNAAIKE